MNTDYCVKTIIKQFLTNIYCFCHSFNLLRIKINLFDNRREQDGVFQVGSRIENQKFIIMKSSKNQEFPPRVSKKGSNIKHFIPKNVKSSKNQDISNTFSWYQERIKIQDLKMTLVKIQELKSSSVLSLRLFIYEIIFDWMGGEV